MNIHPSTIRVTWRNYPTWVTFLTSTLFFTLFVFLYLLRSLFTTIAMSSMFFSQFLSVFWFLVVVPRTRTASMLLVLTSIFATWPTMFFRLFVLIFIISWLFCNISFFLFVVEFSSTSFDQIIKIIRIYFMSFFVKLIQIPSVLFLVFHFFFNQTFRLNIVNYTIPRADFCASSRTSQSSLIKRSVFYCRNPLMAMCSFLAFSFYYFSRCSSIMLMSVPLVISSSSPSRLVNFFSIHIFMSS